MSSDHNTLDKEPRDNKTVTGDMVKSFAQKIPQIISDAPDQDYNNMTETEVDEVIEMIRELENGEEPIMLKICSGRATTEEISEWAASQGIHKDDIDEVLSMMNSSFSAGTAMAEKMETPSDPFEPKLTQSGPDINPDHSVPSIHGSISAPIVRFDQKFLLQRLNTVVRRLDDLRSEVVDLINTINPPPPQSQYSSNPNYEHRVNYSQYL